MGGAEPTAGERREREGGGAADGRGRPISGERHSVREGVGPLGPREGARRAGGSWARNGPTGGRRFSLFLFYFLFLISIFFYLLFF
jgi:hypothetical protein